MAVSRGRLADQVLEVTVVGSWSRLGYLARRRIFDWGEAAAAPGGGRRTAVVCGGSSGIGQATARSLAAAGWSVAIVSSDAERSQSARRAIESAAGWRPGSPAEAGSPATVSAHLADLRDLDEVRRVAAELLGAHGRIDAVVHSAGAAFSDFHRTDQGFEASFALYVLGPHLLTSLLLPSLGAGGGAGSPARSITVSSGGAYLARLDIETLAGMTPARYRGGAAYALCKRAQVELAREWARRLEVGGVPVLALCADPGWVDTPLLERSLPRFHRALRPLLRAPEEGADTVSWLAAAPATELQRGGFYLDRMPRPPALLPRTATTAEQRSAAFERVTELSGAPAAMPT